MRILHINCNYIGSTLHQLMIEKLDAYGVVNEVFVPTYDRNIAVIKPNNNVYVSECFEKRDRVIFDYKQNKILKAIEGHYDIKSFDLIHAYTLYTDGNIAHLLSEKYNIPYVVAVRNTDVNDFLKKMPHLRSRGVNIMRKARFIFFLSPAYEKTVLENYIPKKYVEEINRKTQIIPNGIDDFWHENVYIRDANSIQNRIENTRKLKCIFVGGIDKNKNIELTLKALIELEKKGWECVLTSIGRIIDKRVYDRLIQYRQFKYVEPKAKEELIEYYRNADIFIMPSHTETFGLVYAEAMSQGLPVIYTRGQGFDGQFEDGYVGYSVNDKDQIELASRIVGIINNYREISSNTQKAANKFTWDSICLEYMRIYTNLCLHFETSG